MRSGTMLAAAIAAVAFLPPSVMAAQTCADAVSATDKQVQQGDHGDKWNRIQVKLYIAAQLGQKDDEKGCLRAVREARAIGGLPEGPASGAAIANAASNNAETSKSAPSGSNVKGLDTEGWGTNEAQTAATSPQRPENMVGKTAQSASGEKLGRIVDVLGGSGSAAQLAVATDKKTVAVPVSIARYDQKDNVVVLDTTKKELQDAEALAGGVKLDKSQGAPQ